MIDPTPKTRNRERRYGLFMSDVELFDELGVPEKLGRKAFRILDKPLPGRRRFPQPVAMFGGRRFYPAVYRYLMAEFGGELPDLTTIAPGHWQENFDETDQAARSGNARSRMVPAK